MTGAGATAFAFAGTVYKDTGGTMVSPGITVRMFKPGNNTSLAAAATDDNGNFVIRGQFTEFPYDTHVTACGTTPDIRAMGGLIASANDANCSNTGTCHAIDGGATPVYFTEQ